MAGNRHCPFKLMTISYNWKLIIDYAIAAADNCESIALTGCVLLNLVIIHTLGQKISFFASFWNVFLTDPMNTRRGNNILGFDVCSNSPCFLTASICSVVSAAHVQPLSQSNLVAFASCKRLSGPSRAGGIVWARNVPGVRGSESRPNRGRCLRKQNRHALSINLYKNLNFHDCTNSSWCLNLFSGKGGRCRSF